MAYKDPAKAAAHQKQYRIDNAEKIAAYNREWQEKNGEAKRQRARERYHADIEATRERDRKYRADNFERLSAQWAEYHAANREEIKKKDKIRNAKPKRRMDILLRNTLRGAAVRDTCDPVSAEDFDLLILSCQVCGGSAEQLDHIVPKKRGGCSAIHNLQWLCASCNKRKKARLMHEWLTEDEYWAWADRTHSGGCIHVEVG